MIVLLALILSTGPAAAYCSEELSDTALGAHVVVSSCRNIGTFSVGGYYKGKWEKLTYFYPKSWEGTFLSIQVDGKTYSNSANPSTVRSDAGNMMDPYVSLPPHKNGSSILVKWMLPEKVEITESFTLLENGTIIQITLANRNSRKVAVGARLLLDTMLGENDGAPIYVPGSGLASNETEYLGRAMNFGYWKAYDRAENATVTASCVFDGVGLTYPDKMIIADWKKSMYTSWGYGVNSSRSILGDSSVLLYYNPTVLSPSEVRTISAVYKNGGPVVSFANKTIGIADIVQTNVDKDYLPGDNVTLSVDVISKEAANETGLQISVFDDGGNVLYSQNVSIGSMRADRLYSTNITFAAPGGSAHGKPLRANAILYSGGKRIEWKGKTLQMGEKFPPSFRIRGVQITGSYQKGFTIMAEVANTLPAAKGDIILSIIEEGTIIHESTRSTGIIPQYSKETLNFTWMPEKTASGSIYAVVALYQAEKKLDEMSKEFPEELLAQDVLPVKKPVFSERRGIVEEISGQQTPILALMAAALLVLGGFYAQRAIARRWSGRYVSIEKLREGGNIVLIIKNRGTKALEDCVIEDELPVGIEVLISDLHVIGKGSRLIVSNKDRLIWHMGNLSSGDTAVLEYKMSGTTTLLPAKLKWAGGEKTT
jgi:hypothetical protein